MRLRLAGVLVAVLLLAACGSGPTEPRLPPSAAPRPIPADRAGAPLIRSPRDLGSRAADPCATLLTPEQLRMFGFGRAVERGVDIIGGKTCRWRAGGLGSRQIIVAVELSRDLFVDTYRTRPMSVFLPHEVDGLPAVDLTIPRSTTACRTVVGVADGQTLTVDSAAGTRTGESDDDACEISRRAAHEIVSTLPPL